MIKARLKENHYATAKIAVTGSPENMDPETGHPTALAAEAVAERLEKCLAPLLAGNSP